MSSAIDGSVLCYRKIQIFEKKGLILGIVNVVIHPSSEKHFMNNHGVSYRDLNRQKILLDRQGNACLGDMGVVSSCISAGEVTEHETASYRWLAPETDPNWSNFLYENEKRMINLIDFGAAREYPRSFVDDYLRMVMACANGDRTAVIEMSRRLGFLTGEESEVMLDAHVQAGLIIGLPFAKLGGYDFRSTNVTQSITNLGPTMLKHRLTPPPEESYSLHRKLSGAFLACIKLGAVVPCRELLLEVYQNYQFIENDQAVFSSSAAS